MKKIFLKKEKTKHYIERKSNKYFLAVFVEILAIILWSVGLVEIHIIGTVNPAVLIMHIAALLFTCGSMIFAKFVRVN